MSTRPNSTYMDVHLWDGSSEAMRRFAISPAASRLLCGVRSWSTTTCRVAGRSASTCATRSASSVWTPSRWTTNTTAVRLGRRGGRATASTSSATRPPRSVWPPSTPSPSAVCTAAARSSSSPSSPSGDSFSSLPPDPAESRKVLLSDSGRATMSSTAAVNLSLSTFCAVWFVSSNTNLLNVAESLQNRHSSFLWIKWTGWKSWDVGKERGKGWRKDELEEVGEKEGRKASSRFAVRTARHYCCWTQPSLQATTTTQPSYLHNLITVQPPRSTRSSSLVTLARPSTSSSLRITDNSFQYASLVSGINSWLLSVNHALISQFWLTRPVLSVTFLNRFHRLTTLIIHHPFTVSF